MGLNQLAKTILFNRIKIFQQKQRVTQSGRYRKLSYEYILDRIIFVLVTGCQWTKLEVVNGSWKTIYHYFSIWSKANIFEYAYQDILNVYSKIKGISDELIVDTSFIKNVFGRDCVGPSPFDRGRKATKVSTITDKYGVPVVFSFHKGNKNDSRTLYHTLQKIKQPIIGKKLYADKIYDTQNCREILSKFQLQDYISKKRELVSKESNRVRIVVEHAFSWLDKYRRIILRYDACVNRLRSFHYLAAMHITSNRCSLQI